MELITTDTILERLETAVETHEGLPAAKWLDAAQALIALLGNEHDKLYRLEQAVNKAKLEFLDSSEKISVARAEIEVKATDLYREWRLQDSKIKRVEELIRVAKKQAGLKDNEYGLNYGT